MSAPTPAPTPGSPNGHSDRACIDCGKANVVTVVQRGVGSYSSSFWYICPDCLRRYDAQTAQIKRELEAKALGKTGRPSEPKKSKKRPTAQGDLA